MKARELPEIIQGGMGIGVSGYRLARAVSESGGLGVVSGTAIDTVFIRRLERGEDAAGIRRALARFPFPRLADSVRIRYQGDASGELYPTYRLLSLPTPEMSFERALVAVLASFAETWLAKEGHDGPVGMNLLEKIQLGTLPTLFGAMLAELDVLLMGAGIPTAIPGVLEKLRLLEKTDLKLHVDGAPAGHGFVSTFDPRAFIETCRERELALGGTLGTERVRPKKPLFLAIVSSDILARRLLRSASGPVDGFVVEHHKAGGHNAPPRKPTSEETPYGQVDEANFEVMRSLGVPFWVAGGLATPDGLERAIALGAVGIQLGTAFAYCEESGITPDLRRRVIDGLRHGTIDVTTDFVASPTGYPFKIITDQAEPNEHDALRDRQRLCDLGYLRTAFVDDRGRLGLRCPGEPRGTFEKKGGDLSHCAGKMCLCNQLLATVGLGQTRDGVSELPLLTAGSDIEQVRYFLSPGRHSYHARDVIAVVSGLAGRVVRLPPGALDRALPEVALALHSA